MIGQLESASRYLPDGRLKTKWQRRFDKSSRYDCETGALQTGHEAALESASRFVRRTGVLKARR